VDCLSQIDASSLREADFVAAPRVSSSFN